MMPSRKPSVTEDLETQRRFLSDEHRFKDGGKLLSNRKTDTPATAHASDDRNPSLKHGLFHEGILHSQGQLLKTVAGSRGFVSSY